ncbi:hypothetical protein MKZ38_008082 [Zalerion maritima]|uniref:Major facilitator superfamily (MFS) profile domain-containing protein n=1 Tax=Zalerion maritima TaxID=339359 RepID=A0AAD5WV97_9PEZI|nr:hypothetical protein MKZ38_008082 [Zalerion maritima]
MPSLPLGIRVLFALFNILYHTPPIPKTSAHANFIMSGEVKTSDMPPASRPTGTSSDTPPSTTIGGEMKFAPTNTESNTVSGDIEHQDDDSQLRKEYLRKCDRWVMTMVFLAWFLFYLDRGTISLAYINGMGKDLRLDGKKLNLAVMIFFATYIVVNIPANLILRHVGARYWLSGLIFTWGFVTTMTGFVNNYTGLLISRLFLGLCEGGFLGGALLFLGFFYTRGELMARIGIFFSSTPLAAAVAGLLGLGLGGIHYHGYNGWPWILFVEGAATVILGTFTFFALPDTPDKAWFLSPECRIVARRRLHADSGKVPIDNEAIDNTSQPVKDKLKGDTLKRALTHPLTWLMSISAFCTVSAVYSWNLFMPPIVQSMVQPNERLKANGLTVPPNIAGFISTILITLLARKVQRVGLTIAATALCGVLGFSLLLGGARKGSVAIQYTGTFFAAMGVYPLLPLGLYWITVNARPHFERAIAIGFVVMIGNMGAFVASFTYIPDETPYIKGHGINVGFMLAIIALALVTVRYMQWEHNKRERGERDAQLNGPQGVPQEVHEMYLGWRHPRFRYVM